MSPGRSAVADRAGSPWLSVTVVAAVFGLVDRIVPERRRLPGPSGPVGGPAPARSAPPCRTPIRPSTTSRSCRGWCCGAGAGTAGSRSRCATPPSSSPPARSSAPSAWALGRPLGGARACASLAATLLALGRRRARRPGHPRPRSSLVGTAIGAVAPGRRRGRRPALVAPGRHAHRRRRRALVVAAMARVAGGVRRARRPRRPGGGAGAAAVGAGACRRGLGWVGAPARSSARWSPCVVAFVCGTGAAHEPARAPGRRGSRRRGGGARMRGGGDRRVRGRRRRIGHRDGRP